MRNVPRLFGFPVVWDPDFSDVDFCTALECRARTDAQTRARFRAAAGFDPVAEHWQAHLVQLIRQHREEIEYMPDSSRPSRGPFTPVIPVLRNRGRSTHSSATGHDRAARVFDILRRPENARLRDPNELSERERRDAALSLLDDPDTVRTFRSTATGDDLDEAFRTNDRVATLALLTENAAYRDAFKRALLTPAGTHPMWTDRERRAMVRVDQHVRAQTEGIVAEGGYVVPPSLDPSVTLSDFSATNIWARLCKLVEINSNEWHTLASPGSPWSIKGEAAPAADLSMTSTSQVKIPVYTASGYVEYSIEIEDWPDLTANLSAALTEGYSELILNKLTTGTGQREPTGIVQAMQNAASTTFVTAQTSGAITDTDITRVWSAVPSKFRERSTWMANPTVAGQIREHSTLYHASAVSLDNAIAASEVLLSKQFVENAYLAPFADSTSSTLRLVVGDFSKFAFVRRSGLRIETLQTTPDSATNRPRGTRALLAYARVGSDVLTPNAFRTLSVT